MHYSAVTLLEVVLLPKPDLCSEVPLADVPRTRNCSPVLLPTVFSSHKNFSTTSGSAFAAASVPVYRKQTSSTKISERTENEQNSNTELRILRFLPSATATCAVCAKVDTTSQTRKFISPRAAASGLAEASRPLWDKRLNRFAGRDSGSADRSTSTACHSLADGVATLIGCRNWLRVRTGWAQHTAKGQKPIRVPFCCSMAPRASHAWRNKTWWLAAFGRWCDRDWKFKMLDFRHHPPQGLGQVALQVQAQTWVGQGSCIALRASIRLARGQL